MEFGPPSSRPLPILSALEMDKCCKLFSDLLALLHGRLEKGRMVVLFGDRVLYPYFDMLFR
jgi:hypothetical protein